MASPTMTYRRMGRSGLKLSALSLGGWTTFGGSVRESDVVRAIVRRAYEAGVNFFDMADIYAKGASERAMGDALRGIPRHTLVLSSKVFWPMSDDVNDRGLSRKHVIESVEKSLQRVGTDYFDLYFCHRYDEETPVDETLRAMDDLCRQGKVVYWGTSEWSGERLRDVHARAERRGLDAPAVEQPQLSRLSRKRFESDVAPAAQELGMGLVTWSPLASGVLTGKYDRGVPKDARLAQIDWLREDLLTPTNLERTARFGALAREIGVDQSALAIAWALCAPGVSSVITGATRLEQLETNLTALDVELDQATCARLDEIFPPTA